MVRRTRFGWGRSTVALVLLAGCQAGRGAEVGEEIFEACSPCHGANGEGNQAIGAPALAGASEWYVSDQLVKFGTGFRGYDHTDAEGLKMYPMARLLLTGAGGRETQLDSARLQAVSAYISGLESVDPPATGVAERGDPEAGRALYDATCANCHRLDGTGIRSLQAPSLLHLSDWYLQRSIRKYRDRVRGGQPGDIAAAMYASVSNISDDDIDDIVAHIVSLEIRPKRVELPPAPPPPPPEIDPVLLPPGVTAAILEDGSRIFHQTGICFTCHLEAGQGGPQAPNLTDDEWLNIGGSYAEIVELIETGVAQPLQYPGAMLPRAGVPLSDSDVRAVAAYVFALSR